MNTKVATTEKKVSTKKVTSKGIESKSIDLLKAIKTVSTKKAQKENLVSFKQTQKFNAEFKKDNLSLGAIRNNILNFNDSLNANDENKLSPLLVDLLIKMKTKQNYEFVKENFLPNTKGFYSSYKLLMYFRTNLTLLQSTFK
jgi:hypothetical protein